MSARTVRPIARAGSDPGRMTAPIRRAYQVVTRPRRAPRFFAATFEPLEKRFRRRRVHVQALLDRDHPDVAALALPLEPVPWEWDASD